MSASDRLPFLERSNPELWRSLNGLALKVSQATEAAGLSRETIELMNVRISQLNGCAYCLDLHTRLAIEAGATAQRLAQLPTWSDSGLFTEIESAVLAVAEVTTELPSRNDRVAVLESALETLGEQAFAAAEWAAVTMNAYNRLSILSGHPVTLNKGWPSTP